MDKANCKQMMASLGGGGQAGWAKMTSTGGKLTACQTNKKVNKAEELTYPGNTKGGSITLPFTSCVTDLD